MRCSSGLPTTGSRAGRLPSSRLRGGESSRGVGTDAVPGPWSGMILWSVRFRAGDYLRGSLWVVPTLGGVVGLILARISARIDESVQLPAQWDYTHGTATTVLTTIAG